MHQLVPCHIICHTASAVMAYHLSEHIICHGTSALLPLSCGRKVYMVSFQMPYFIWTQSISQCSKWNVDICRLNLYYTYVCLPSHYSLGLQVYFAETVVFCLCVGILKKETKVSARGCQVMLFWTQCYVWLWQVTECCCLFSSQLFQPRTCLWVFNYCANDKISPEHVCSMLQVPGIVEITL